MFLCSLWTSVLAQAVISRKSAAQASPHAKGVDEPEFQTNAEPEEDPRIFEVTWDTELFSKSSEMQREQTEQDNLKEARARALVAPRPHRRQLPSLALPLPRAPPVLA